MFELKLRGKENFLSQEFLSRGFFSPVKLLNNVVAVFTLSLMPILWNELSKEYSFYVTLSAAILMLASVAIARGYELVDPRTALLTGIYLLLFGVCATISYTLVADAAPGRGDHLTYYWGILVFGALYFAFGGVIAATPPRAGIVSAFLILACYTVIQRESFQISGLQARGFTEGIDTPYQQLGDSFAICSIAVLAFVRRSWLAAIIAMVSIALLFVLPSRSAAVFGSIALLATIALYATLRMRVFLTVVIAIAVIVLQGPIIREVNVAFEGSRHQAIIISPSEDESNLERATILSVGMRVIRDNPIFGYFGFEYAKFGEGGYYIHNVLDIWAQAGVFPFAAFALLWFYLCRQVWLLYARDKTLAIPAIGLLMFVALSWIFARHAANAHLYLCLGYMAGVMQAAYGSFLPSPRADKSWHQ